MGNHSQQHHPSSPTKTRGEGDYAGAARYQQEATEHARSGRVGPAAEAARGDREARPGYLDEAEQAGKARMAEEDPLLYRPRWWAKKFDSLWDRARAALARDWEQTKRDFRREAGPDLEQSALDTIHQIAGAPVPSGDQPTKKPASWRSIDPMTRIGYAAGLRARRDWDEKAEAAMKAEWEESNSPLDWEQARGCMQFGWTASRGKLSLLQGPEAIPPEELHDN